MSRKKQNSTEAIVLLICLFLFGVFTLIPIYPPFGILWCAVMGSVLGGIVGSVKKKQKGKSKAAPAFTDTLRSGRSRAGIENSRQHGHTPVSYSYDHCAMEKRLEQLDVLKGAGLLDEMEYQQRREEILSMSVARR